MDRRRFVTTTALGTAAGLLGRQGLEAGAGAAGERPQLPPPSGADVMRREHQARSGIALGGLGTGSAEPHKDGRFHNWTCFNNEPQFTGARLAWPQDSILFFVLRYQLPGREPRLKLLQIESDRHEQGAVEMALYEMPWLSGVDSITYRARFPFAWLTYADDPEGDADGERMPLEIELEAMSPFVPHDVLASSLPAMLLDLRVRSLVSKPVDVMLTAALRSVVGYDSADKVHATRLERRPGAVLCTMTATGMDPQASSLGTMTLASVSDDSSFYLGWEHRHPYYERLLREKRLPDLDDTDGRNPVDRGTGKKRAMERLWSTLGRSATIAPGDTLEHGFVVAWHFPNLWDEHRTHVEGRAYAKRFSDSSTVASHAIEKESDLVGRSRAFQAAFYDSSAPGYVLDQVNSQLNTFATSSWLTAAGDFGILEGMAPDQSWGPIARWTSRCTAAWWWRRSSPSFRRRRCARTAASRPTRGRCRTGSRRTSCAVEVHTGPLHWREMRFLPARPSVHPSVGAWTAAAPSLRLQVAPEDGAIVVRPQAGAAVLIPGQSLEIAFER